MTTEPEAHEPAAPPPAKYPAPGAGHSKSALAAIVGAIALVAFGAGAWFFGVGPDNRSTPPLESAAPTHPAMPAPVAGANPPRMIEQGAPFSFADLVERVSPAVVTILVDREERVDQNGGSTSSPLENFLQQFGQDEPRVLRGEALGSGFIIDGEGYIVTNNHVVESGVRISVKLPDGREFQAKVVGSDAATDVALLKIDGVHNLPTVAFGDDSRIRVGDWVVAVGNPFGLGGTVTAGIVSSIGRDIGEGPYTDYIQIDAPINQGNSGGPTFDLSGRVIGMNSAIYSPSGGSVGIGFAIPASIVQETVQQIKEHGSVTRGWLGVEIQNLTPDMAASLGIAGAKGAIVARVVPGGPADKAGLRQGDVVLSINGREVDDSRDMTRRVGMLHAGEKAEFAIVRAGQHTTVSAVITKREDRQVASLPQNTPQPGSGKEATVASLGMRMVGLDDETRRQYNLGRDSVGVLVTAVDPNSEAAGKGFRPGDVIVSVGNKDVRTPDDVEQGLRDAAGAGRDSALFLVATEQGQRFVALHVGRG